MKKIDIFLSIFFHVLVLLTMLVLFVPDFGDNFAVSKWITSDSYADVNYAYAIAFIVLVSFLGALIPIPIPYIIPAGNFALAWYENESNPWLKIIPMIFFAALGNSLGDFVDYIIGKGANAAIEKDNPKQIEKWTKKFEENPKSIPWVIFFFALLPLPDSLLLVPLGLVKYPPKKTLIFMYIGKVCMFAVVVAGWILGADLIMDALGDEGGSPWIGMGLLYLIWIMIFVMAKKE